MSAIYDAYICGPMAGHDKLNIHKFRAVKNYLKSALKMSAIIPHEIAPHPHDPDNPHCPESFRKNPNSEHAECCYLRGDIIVMLRDCKSVYILPGWNASNGGRLELMIAAQAGLPTVFIDHNQLVEMMYNSTRSNILKPPLGWKASVDG